MALGARAGLNTRTLFDIISNAAGSSWYTLQPSVTVYYPQLFICLSYWERYFICWNAFFTSYWLSYPYCNFKEVLKFLHFDSFVWMPCKSLFLCCTPLVVNTTYYGDDYHKFLHIFLISLVHIRSSVRQFRANAHYLFVVDRGSPWDKSVMLARFPGTIPGFAQKVSLIGIAGDLMPPIPPILS